jgi:excinuclease ABC subunit C
MSHLQGTDYVGSMVVFEDGLPKKSDYRHFRVATVAGNDDYAAMEEVLTRRLTSLLADDRLVADDRSAATGLQTDVGDGAERYGSGVGESPASAVAPNGVEPPTTSPPKRRFAYPPQLLLLDGGLGQLNVGIRVLENLGLTERIPIASLAKSFEEVYRPGRSEPYRLSRQSEGLYLLQRLRDEAHRFAISYHRTLRGKRMTLGALDGINGLGPKRRERLIEQFGGLAELRKVSKEELLGVSWLPAEVGASVFERLHTPMAPSGPAER